ncbi:MAG: 23S rRNA (guanosine(2251)-2'-O)-methyltransferase RlmB [Bdellovibrionales bacterium]|nr:23S rRNA (guanosine(2251)-2'-O)-methyltransferase RlmB [Bdellovibrionales bacterium]
MSSNDILIKNPHSILIALKNRPKEVVEITFPKDRSEGVWKEIEALVERHKVRKSAGVSEKPAHRPQDSRRGRGPGNDRDINSGRESGHGALVRQKSQTSLEKLFSGIDQDTRGLWLALDCLQDPQNVGAIFRAAAFFGIKGIVMTTERSAPMTGTVYDIACGGVEVVPFVQTINMKQALDKAKEAGLWILGTSEHAKETLNRVQKDRPWLMVVGNEEKGIRRLTEESCDVMCSIPNAGTEVTSLNVSVATGILLSHLG